MALNLLRFLILINMFFLGVTQVLAEGEIRGTGLFSFGNYGYFPKSWSLHKRENSIRYVREGMYAIYIWVDLERSNVSDETIECAKSQIYQLKEALNFMDPVDLNPLFKRDGPLMIWDMVVKDKSILAVNVSQMSVELKDPFYSAKGLDEYHVQFSFLDGNCSTTTSESIRTHLLQLAQ